MEKKNSQKYSIFKLLISYEHTIMAILGVLVGLAGGFGAVGFRHLINFIQSISYGSVADLLDAVKEIPW